MVEEGEAGMKGVRERGREAGREAGYESEVGKTGQNKGKMDRRKAKGDGEEKERMKEQRTTGRTD